MARKIPAKLILEYRAMGLSRNLIAKTKKVGRDSVSDVFKRADDLDLTYKDVEDLSETAVYQKLFPERYQSETLYELPEYGCFATRKYIEMQRKVQRVATLQSTLNE